MKKQDLETIVNDLEEAASLSGDEIGEWWSVLTRLFPYINSGSDEFRKAYELELRAEHKVFKEDFRIVETDTSVVSKRRVRELRHISEE